MNKKKPLLLAACSGILLSIPWLLPHTGILMLLALVPLLLAEQLIHKNTGSLSAIFVNAYFAFLIWNVATCWWIAYVSLFGMLLITALNALLMAAVWWGKSFVQNRLGTTSGYFAFLAFWTTFEFLHQNWSLRWPWLTLGNGFAGSVKLVQWYEYSGVLGGSFWILLSNILIFNAFQDFIHHESRMKFKNILAAFLVISLPIIWSLTRYYSYHEKPDPCEIVVLQPNIDPFTQKFSGTTTNQQVNLLIQLAGSTVSQTTDFVLAPETALPECSEDSAISENPEFKPILNFLQKNPKVNFVAGAVTRHPFSKTKTPSETAHLSKDRDYYYDLYNSALLIDTSQHIQICHKSILVSGVERMPFQEYFSFLQKYLIDLGGASGSFAAAREPELFRNSRNIKVGPVICFESVFGAQAATLVRKGAEILFVITNDGWWKKSVGIGQHFSYARIRAIETRRCVARSANTGISGFINQRGDVLKQTRINEITAIAGTLNRNTELTFYVQHQNLPGLISVSFTVLIIFYLAFRKLKTND